MPAALALKFGLLDVATAIPISGMARVSVPPARVILVANPAGKLAPLAMTR